MFYVNSKIHPKRPLIMAVVLFTSLFLLACGGGSSSGASTDVSSGGAENAAPTVNAGADTTINAGTTVELVADASDTDGDIVSRSWDQTSGPSVTLTAVDLDAANFTFVAPSTGVEATVELVFELTVADDDGAEASDTVVFTVNRVNQAPVAVAGEDQSVDGLTEVTLSGSATDSDGTVETYSWKQTGGMETVELTGKDSALANFTAPSATSILNLEFTLTVTDSDGEQASDIVAVTVIPENAPLVEMIFPPATGVYTAQEIDAFGTVAPKNGATIASVEVTAGVAPVAATVNPDGSWRAENIQIPAGIAEFSVTVTASDSAGLSRSADATLQTSGDSIGSGEAWDQSTAVAVDPDTGTAYVLTEGLYLSDVKLIPINVSTGERGESITDFSDSSQGTTVTAFTHMVFDKVNERFFIASSPADSSLMKQIISVDLNTGVRTIISNDVTGTGPSFTLPSGLALGPLGTLFVADNGGPTTLDAIFAVDIASGDRTIIADANSESFPIEVPLHVTWDEVGQQLFVSTNTYDPTLILGVTLSTDPAETSIFTQNFDADSGPDMHKKSFGLIADSDNNRIFMMDSYADQVLTIGMADGIRTLLADEVTGSDTSSYGVQHGMAYDSVNELLYVVGGRYSGNHGLFVLDTASGDKVLLSRD